MSSTIVRKASILGKKPSIKENSKPKLKKRDSVRILEEKTAKQMEQKKKI